MFEIWRDEIRWMTCGTREAAEATVAFRLNHRAWADPKGVRYEIRER